jgi:energy-coupling factor transporter transmembrane protein EcfT
MLCRGFRRKFYCLHEFDAGRREWVFAIIMSGIIMLLIYFEWM